MTKKQDGPKIPQDVRSAMLGTFGDAHMQPTMIPINNPQNVNTKLLVALEEYLNWHETNFVLPSGNFEDPDQQALAKEARAVISEAKATLPR